MRERRDGQGLALEAGQELAVLGDGRGKDLDRDVALELRVPGPVDLAHAAHADPVEDPVGPEALAFREYHWMSSAELYQRGWGRPA